MNNRGFTLIELMIVVAIIGILAAILIPAFTGSSKPAPRVESVTQVTCYHATTGTSGPVLFTGFGKDTIGGFQTTDGQLMEFPEDWFCTRTSMPQ